jgi:small subunit ribosomal protein S18
MAIDEMAKQASAGGESEVKFLTPLDINTKSEKNIVDSKNSELST